ncbi:MAG: metal-sensitive transcriptional regulator [Rickettsiales bacterium]|jgi:DNA-binding FrmR family transcriptional regulator|nr:metal-sensitive transcriptional regulator [Rickettsiales bacterium]
MKRNACNNYPSHEAELARLNRAAGQLEGAKKMILDGRYCPDILALLKGVRAAVHAVEGNILKRHLESCVADSFADKKTAGAKIAEIKTLLAKAV